MFNRTSSTPTKTPSPLPPRSNIPITPQTASHTPPAPTSSQPRGGAEVTAKATDPTIDSGSRLIVGPDVKLRSAEILDCDTLVVEGRVEATMDSRVIRIAENGLYCGKVCIDIAEIRGQFEGELTARSQLLIHATGRVSGKIRYGKMLIEEGGQISGEIQSIEEETSRPAPARASVVPAPPALTAA